ncbi:MAG: nickel ABC transporter substrate-binding protein [Pseudomonadota bacterium]
MAGALAVSAFAAPATADTKTLTFANFRDIRDVNPHGYGGAMFAQDWLYDGLLVLDENAEPSPALAESFRVSEDGKVYTFNLREGVTFSDGHPFNAEVAKQNLDAILANEDRHNWLKSMQLMLAYQATGADAIEAVDENTLRINLTEAYYPFVIELAVTRPYRMISPNCFVDGGTMEGVSCTVGTGAYALESNTVDQEAVFVRHEGHWGAAPEIDKIVVKVIPDAQARLLALQNGEIDMIYGKDMIPPRSFLDLEKREGFSTVMSPPVATKMLILNASKPALSDGALRSALNYYTNRELISERIMLGLEPPAGTLMSEAIPYADIGLDPFSFQPERADALLTEAGYEKVDGKWTKDGAPIELKLTYNSDDATQKILSQFLQSEWGKLGIALEIAAVERQAQRDTLRTGDFEVAFNVSWGLPYDPQSFLGSMVKPVYGDFHAQSGLSNKAEIDAAIGGALGAVDEGKRQDFYSYVLSSLHEGSIYVPLTFEANRAVYSDKLGDVVFNINQFEVPVERMSLK